MKCRVADFNVEFVHHYAHLARMCAAYSAEFDTPDFFIEIPHDEIEKGLAELPVESNLECFEGVLAYRLLADKMAHRDAFVLHSALFDVDGTGIALAAASGTGKTTHMRLWKRMLGDRMKIVNGDKPTIRFFEDSEQPFAYGTPWNGKEHYGCNMRTTLRHICFIERGEQNSIVPLEKDDAINRIFNQVYIPSNPAAMLATMSLIDRTLSVCKLWKITANMDISAAKTAYNKIFSKE